jgi:hypothetical protein
MMYMFPLPCDHVGDSRGDRLNLLRELIPLREVPVGVGDVANVEHDIGVVKVSDQRVRGVE